MPRKPREFGLLPRRPERKPEPEPSLLGDIETVDEGVVKDLSSRLPDWPIEDVIEFLKVALQRFEGMSLNDIQEFLNDPGNAHVRDEIMDAVGARKRFREDPHAEFTTDVETGDVVEEEGYSILDLTDVLAEDPTKEYVSFDPEKAEDMPSRPSGESRRPGVELRKKYPGPGAFQTSERSIGSVLRQVKTAAGWNTPFIPGRFFPSSNELVKAALGTISKIAWKEVPFQHGRKPPSQPKPGDIANRYCAKCRETTKHELLPDGAEVCQRCERVKYPVEARVRVVVKVAGF